MQTATSSEEEGGWHASNASNEDHPLHNHFDDDSLLNHFDDILNDDLNDDQDVSDNYLIRLTVMGYQNEYITDGDVVLYDRYTQMQHNVKRCNTMVQYCHDIANRVMLWWELNRRERQSF